MSEPTQAVYTPIISGPWKSELPSRVYPAQPISGNGAPEGVVAGNPGQRYNDLLTGNLWIKIQGTGVLGWELRGVVGGSGLQVIG